MDIRADRGGKRMAKVLIDGFRHEVGRHCESTAMRDMFEFYGHPITEAMAFGLDATMGFAFWDASSQENIFKDTYEGMVPFFIGGKSSSISENSLACRVLGVIIKQETSDSADKAWKISKELINNNTPHIIKTDMYYLPYSDTYEKFHFGGHTISLVGYDDDKDVAFICAGLDRGSTEVLDLTVKESLEVFKGQTNIVKILEILDKIGMGYMTLGQSSLTLSGGEAQRVKLAKELGREKKAHSLLILDEPSTGLHSYDIAKLLTLLNELVERGNSVVIIEHDLDILSYTDWIIELGPGGGPAGGEIIAEGSPEDLNLNKNSIIGKYFG